MIFDYGPFEPSKTSFIISFSKKSVCLCSAPLYKLVTTDLGGEKRFASAVARRLQSLGALTRGDRRAASGVDLSEWNIDSPLGRKVRLEEGTCTCETFAFCCSNDEGGLKMSSVVPGLLSELPTSKTA